MEKRKYEIRKREDGRKAIFDVETGEQISDWWYSISYAGIVKNQSEYYQVMDAYDYCAIFHKDGRQISNWYEYVSTEGLVEGQSKYYIIATGDDSYAIVDVDGKVITPYWFDYVWPDGLVKGERDIYLAEMNNKLAFFHKDRKMLSPQFFHGLLFNCSFFKKDCKEEYYIGIERRGEKRKWAIYHLYTGKKVSKYYRFSLRNVEDLNFDTTGILELKYKNGKVKTVEFKPVKTTENQQETENQENQQPS
jgi:hypothetical protein